MPGLYLHDNTLNKWTQHSYIPIALIIFRSMEVITNSLPVGLLHSSSCGCGLPGSLSGKLLPRGFSSSRFSGSLFGASHLRIDATLVL